MVGLYTILTRWLGRYKGNKLQDGVREIHTLAPDGPLPFLSWLPFEVGSLPVVAARGLPAVAGAAAAAAVAVVKSTAAVVKEIVALVAVIEAVAVVVAAAVVTLAARWCTLAVVAAAGELATPVRQTRGPRPSESVEAAVAEDGEAYSRRRRWRAGWWEARRRPSL